MADGGNPSGDATFEIKGVGKPQVCPDNPLNCNSSWEIFLTRCSIILGLWHPLLIEES